MFIVTTFLILLGTILATFILVPRIVVVARSKRLMDQPNSRSSHTQLTPNLGGVSFFVALMVAVYFIGTFTKVGIPLNLFPCLTVLLIVGLKDDLMGVSARTKFIAQFVVTGFIIFDPGFEVINLNGFMELYELPFWAISLLVMVIVTGVINAMNLIDGVDGLASMVGIIGLTGFAYFFYETQMISSFLLCVAMAGCLIGFLPHNFSKDKKIFMGDTGSMMLGFVIAYLAIKALSIPSFKLELLPIDVENIPFLLVSFIFIPLMDTVRIMTVRIIKGKSPFKPDRTHLHHYFIFIKRLPHWKTSVVIAGFALLFTILGYVSSLFFPYWVNILILIGAYMLSVFVSIDLIKQSKKKNRLTNPGFFSVLNSSLRSLFF